jgi:hypothetical protein
MLRTDDTNYLTGIGKHSKIREKITRPFHSRTCLGCRAYVNDKCILGHKIEVDVSKLSHHLTTHRTSERCEKPLTWEALKKCQKKKNTSL